MYTTRNTRDTRQIRRSNHRQARYAGSTGSRRPRSLRAFVQATLLALLSCAASGAIGDALQSAKDPFAEPQFLPVDEAFVWSAALEKGRLVVRWRMSAGYYLYRHAFALDADEDVALGALDIPPGKRIVDDYFGESEVYYGDVEISAAVLRCGSATITARIRYQGCADYGLCYPPQLRTVAFDVDGARIATSESAGSAPMDVKGSAGSAANRGDQGDVGVHGGKRHMP